MFVRDEKKLRTELQSCFPVCFCLFPPLVSNLLSPFSSKSKFKLLCSSFFVLSNTGRFQERFDSIRLRGRKATVAATLTVHSHLVFSFLFLFISFSSVFAPLRATINQSFTFLLRFCVCRSLVRRSVYTRSWFFGSR